MKKIICFLMIYCILGMINAFANQLPTLTSSSSYFTPVGHELKVQLEYEDLDGDEVTFSLDFPYSQVTLSESGLFTFRGSIERLHLIRVHLDDGIGTRSISLYIYVEEFDKISLNESTVLEVSGLDSSSYYQLEIDAIHSGNRLLFLLESIDPNLELLIRKSDIPYKDEYDGRMGFGYGEVYGYDQESFPKLTSGNYFFKLYKNEPSQETESANLTVLLEGDIRDPSLTPPVLNIPVVHDAIHMVPFELPIDVYDADHEPVSISLHSPIIDGLELGSDNILRWLPSAPGKTIRLRLEDGENTRLEVLRLNALSFPELTLNETQTLSLYPNEASSYYMIDVPSLSAGNRLYFDFEIPGSRGAVISTAYQKIPDSSNTEFKIISSIHNERNYILYTEEEPHSLKEGQYIMKVERESHIGSVFLSVTPRLIGANLAPEMDSPTDKNIRLGESLSLNFNTFDLENDELFYSISEGPNDAFIEGGSLFWKPTELQKVHFRVQVSDGDLSDEVEFDVLVTPQIAVQENTAVINPPSEDDDFGASLELLNNDFYVGAPFTDHGVVSHFSGNGLNWSFQSNIVPSDASVFLEFGKSVSASGNYVFIGSDHDNNVVYVFQKSGDVFNHVQSITEGGDYFFDNFGDSITSSENLLVISGVDSDDGVRVFVYSIISDRWEKVQTLSDFDDDISVSDKISLDLEDGILVIGSDTELVNIFQAKGIGFVYSGNFVKDTSSNFIDHHEFVDILANHVLVGSNRGDGVLDYTGVVDLIELSDGQVVNSTTFISSDGEPFDSFGSVVAMSNLFVAVSATGHGHGAVYIYEKVNGTWTQVKKLISNSPSAFKDFGRSLLFLEDHILAIGVGSFFGAYEIELFDLENSIPVVDHSALRERLIPLDGRFQLVLSEGFNLINGPKGMTFSDNILSWSPEQVGEVTALISYEENGVKTFETIVIKVEDSNLISEVKLSEDEVKVSGNIYLEEIDLASSEDYTFKYTWMMNDVALAGANTTLLEISEFKEVIKGSKLSLEVTPYLNGSELESIVSNVTEVVNSLPKLKSLRLSYSQNQIELISNAINLTDDDGDDLKVLYKWYKNNHFFSETSGRKLKLIDSIDGDVWKVEALINDGDVNVSFLSNDITLLEFNPNIERMSVSSNVGFADTEFMVRLDTRNEELVSEYFMDLNNDGIIDYSTESNVLLFHLKKGNHQLGFGLKSKGGFTSGFNYNLEHILIKNSAPKVKAGSDRSGGLNDRVNILAFAKDIDTEDRLTYHWDWVSSFGNISILSDNTKRLSVSSNTEGAYQFQVTASDGNTFSSDNVTVFIEDYFSETTDSEDVDLDVINSLENIFVGDEDDVVKYLEETFDVAKKQLTMEQRRTALNALDQVFISSDEIPLDSSQLSQVLGTLDNLVKEDDATDDELGDDEVLAITNVVESIFDSGSELGSEQISKSFEVLSELVQNKNLNHEETNLDSSVEQSIAEIMIKVVKMSVDNLEGDIDYDQDHIKLRASRIQNFEAEVEVGDFQEGYLIELPKGFVESSKTISAAKLSVNPHKGKVDSSLKEPLGEIVSFNITEPESGLDFVFDGNIQLTIPLPEGTLSGGNTFKPYFFDEENLVWSDDGISEVTIDNAESVLTFKVTHLTDFGAIEGEADVVSSSSGSGGGGGCLLK